MYKEETVKKSGDNLFTVSKQKLTIWKKFQ
jgi:hypothetical protein